MGRGGAIEAKNFPRSMGLAWGNPDIQLCELKHNDTDMYTWSSATLRGGRRGHFTPIF
jgi:hypothetical protein